MCVLPLLLLPVGQAQAATDTDSIYQSTTSNATLAAVNWWSVGWKVLVHGADKLINLDGSSRHSATETYLVSPSIHFNDGTTKNEFYFRPQVQKNTSQISVHAHRAVFIDIFAKISITISDATGKTRASGTQGSNQYLDYKPTSGYGRWKVSYQTTSNNNWQCYYDQWTKTASASNSINAASANGNFLRTTNDSVLSYSSNYKPIASNSTNQSLDATALNDQFVDSADNKTVDYLKDYAVGDIVHFSDIINSISYDSSDNATSISFLEGKTKHPVTWKFKGDLTDSYKNGSPLNLNFKVVELNKYNGIVFDTLNYFQDAETQASVHSYPDISKYL